MERDKNEKKESKDRRGRKEALEKGERENVRGDTDKRN